MKERIIESAWRQITKYGVRRFTVQDIASDIGISKKTIYVHFEGKEAIIQNLVEKFIKEDWLAHLEIMEKEADFFEKVDALIDSEVHRKITSSFMADLSRFYPSIFEQFVKEDDFHREVFTELMAEAVKAGIVRKDIHPEIMIFIVERTMEAYSDPSFLRICDISLQQCLHMLKDLLLYGILEPNVHRGGETP